MSATARSGIRRKHTWLLTSIAVPALLFSSGCYAIVETLPDIPDPTMADNVDDYVCTEYLIPNDTSDNTTFTWYPTLGAVKAAPTISGELVFFADDQGQQSGTYDVGRVVLVCISKL